MSIPKNTIITVDCGANGGIAVYAKGKITAVKMPKDISALKNYFLYLRETYEHIVVFVEKVNSFVKDTDEPGKRFGIDKLLKNHTQVVTTLENLNFEIVDVYPVTWQTTLGLKEKGDQRSKSERKKDYAIFAQECFPSLKVTLNTADALCLVQFALVKIEYDIEWIRERLNRPKQQKLL